MNKMDKKVIIITDLEGVSGVDSINMIDESTEGYQRARKLLMEDVNAAVDGAFAGGATEVFVVDGHCSGHNFIKEDLDSRAKQIEAKEFVESMQYIFDAAFSIGCHAMAGVEKAFLDHTQSSLRWFDYKVGGLSYGEIGQQAITFGAYDIPLVCVTGDKAACDEAQALIDGISVASVKTAEKRNEADCLPLEETRKLIYNAAKEGVLKSENIKPYKIDLPTHIEITYTRNDYCEFEMQFDSKVTRNGRTLTKTVDKITCLKDIL